MYIENCCSNNVVVTPHDFLYTHVCYADVTLSHITRINGETLCFVNCMSERNLPWPHSQIFSHSSRAVVGPDLLFVEVSASHSDTLHSVGFLRMGDRPDTETTT
jgi:hypothetical protein